MQKNYILILSCEDRAGIVAAVSGFLFEIGGFIIESAQFGDEFTNKFFLRAEFSADKKIEELKEKFSTIAQKFKMNFGFYDKTKKSKILIAVSKASHCLAHLLHKNEIGVLPAEIVGIVSNHIDLKNWAERFNVNFYHLPILSANPPPILPPQVGGGSIEKNLPPFKGGGKVEGDLTSSKAQQEQNFYSLFLETNADLLVLARYMQILSNDFSKKLEGKAINIHHSFLPSFKGAKPYHQAFDRGVKIIGATAHYVTENLDEGPIIEQEIARVNHKFKPEELKQVGEDIENKVLLNAVKWHLEHRVILNGNKTVVFN